MNCDSYSFVSSLNEQVIFPVNGHQPEHKNVDKLEKKRIVFAYKRKYTTFAVQNLKRAICTQL
jgi:hypothetical protein